MNILFLEPYLGQSHEYFIKVWQKHSIHNFELLHLPANKWKWRMRHSAFYFAEAVKEKIKAGKKYDLIFCSDMLNLAEFAGLTAEITAEIPKVVYFHENQLTYPNQFESERDYQYVITNFTTALAADKVIFNSSFHMNDFLPALEKFLKKMPDNYPKSQLKQIADKSIVIHPGIEAVKPDLNLPRKEPVTILWAARWEHDKNPQDFFKALEILKAKKLNFKINVIGQQFASSPAIFQQARIKFADNICKWGYQHSLQDYYDSLRQSDIIVSTAIHEFFGITVLQAISAGAYPLLPNRLSYPELIKNNSQHLYGQRAEELAGKLEEIIKNPDMIRSFDSTVIAKDFDGKKQAKLLDAAISF